MQVHHPTRLRPISESDTKVGQGSSPFDGSRHGSLVIGPAMPTDGARSESPNVVPTHVWARQRGLTLALIGGLALVPGSASGQMVSPDGELLRATIESMRSCSKDDLSTESEANPSACNVFVARALNGLHGIDDFGPDPAVGHFMRSNEIAAALTTFSTWHRIGNAGDQVARKEACQRADGREPVIAVWDSGDDTPGHIVVILPGPCKTTSWGLFVPNSASYFLNKSVELAYSGYPMSQAFRKETAGDVQLWYRDKP